MGVDNINLSNLPKPSPIHPNKGEGFLIFKFFLKLSFSFFWLQKIFG